ncbi:MAG: hypothetical protein K8T91_18425 [Planctomycetes bacterium]|nr:hypothetical protein [Planctomycetota bacterium]
MDHFAKSTRSRRQLLKGGRMHVTWSSTQKIENRSKDFGITDLEWAIGTVGAKYNVELNLPDLLCDWLDVSIPMAINSPPGAMIIQGETTLGEKFPLRPKLDREGFLSDSMQMSLLSSISELRRSLVEDSHDFSSTRWIGKLRLLFFESVSLIENTLHQLYFRAKYAPRPGWRFDQAGLGPRHGQRIMNKLQWVGLITGRSIVDQKPVNAFRRVKDLRNHLAHLDPPVFCATMEDVAGWLCTWRRKWVDHGWESPDNSDGLW